MIRSSTTRLLAIAALGIVGSIAATACREDPPPQQPVVVQQTPPPSGISAEMMVKIGLACDHIVRCKNAGVDRGQHESCVRDLSKPESYQGACGQQQIQLVECVQSAQSCDQTVCATQSAAVTACGSLPAGLLNGFLNGK